MRIGVFVLMAGREAGGPETYEIELLRALAAIDRENEYVVYCTSDSAVQAIGVTQENVRYRVLRPGTRWVSIPAMLPLLVRRDGIHFLHSTFTPPPFLPVGQLLTMHCVSSFVHPEFYAPRVAWRLNRLLERGVRRAGCIVCVSDATRQDVHRLFGVPPDRMVVAHNGVGREFRPVPLDVARSVVRKRFGLDEPYMLYVGKLEPRKNVQRLVAAFARFRHETRSSTRLLLAGIRTPTTPDLDTLIASHGIADAIVRPGYIARADLPAAYSAARAFLFPSLWEGFGIPIVEAMACGTPVLTSNVTCLPEIAGDAAVIVDPTSVDAIARGLAELDTSASLRQQLVARGLERARQFTWERSARATLGAYTRMRVH